jgi:hypothetical protein
MALLQAFSSSVHNGLYCIGNFAAQAEPFMYVRRVALNVKPSTIFASLIFTYGLYAGAGATRLSRMWLAELPIVIISIALL